MIHTHQPEEDWNFKSFLFFTASLFASCGALLCVLMYFWSLIPTMADPKPGVEKIVPRFRGCDTIQMERATTYQPTVAQCYSDPLTTADGSRINPNNYQRWVALSRDLLSRWGGEFDYGDTLTIYSKIHPNLNGEWVVHDCMNSRYKMSIDFLMEPEKNYPKLGIGKDVKIIVCYEN